MGIDGTERWEVVGGIEVEGACCGFGDSAVVAVTRSDFLDRIDWEAEVYDFTPDGIPFVGANTKADALFPVEVSRDDRGAISAARVCFTDDLDDLPGLWRPAGMVPITSDSCIAADPFNMATSPTSVVVFPVTIGPAEVEVFLYAEDDEDAADLLGIRVTFAR